MSDSSREEKVKQMWAELRMIVESMERDLDKNVQKGNSAAGRRVRSQLRDVKKRSADMIREMVQLDKERKE